MYNHRIFLFLLNPWGSRKGKKFVFSLLLFLLLSFPSFSAEGKRRLGEMGGKERQGVERKEGSVVGKVEEGNGEKGIEKKDGKRI